MKKKNKSKKKSMHARVVESRQPQAAAQEPAQAGADLSETSKAKLKARGLEQLVQLGKEKGFLTYDDINRLLPQHVTSSEEIDDILLALSAQTIDVVDSEEAGAKDALELIDDDDESTINDWQETQVEFVRGYAQDAAAVSQLKGDAKTKARDAMPLGPGS